ncbi:MAG: glycogen/starch/alpha-glucan phosphorylase, partial [Oscillospiraceae bacterium]
MEFLVGRSLKNNLYNLEINEAAEKLLEECGLKLEMLYDMEPDAGLGNGGLGRLAACYLDGLATQDYTATGYSILYEYGIFKQKIIAGWQQELADNWLPGGTVWLEKRADEAFEVRFDGEIKEHWYDGYHHIEHVGYNSVMAVPYDMYISGYDSSSVSKLRLWQSVSPGIDMDSFNRGDYTSALRANSTSELISKVLYPNDNHIEGKVLRLRQQYFLCSASINDIVQKHLAQYGTLDNLPKKIAVHINDTHPTLSIPELMRILLDECGYGWDDAMDIAKKTFAYTNHTVMSEALEKWNIDMFKTVLPRIYQIIEEIDRSLVRELSTRFPGDLGKASYMRILGDGNVRMANLCIYMSHSVNGVSKLHSDIIKEEIFRDFYLFSPEKFKNVTNGIAYRRWLLQSNEGLTELLTEKIGNGFKKDADELKRFENYADDSRVHERLAAIKLANKCRLAEYAGKSLPHPINSESIFDVQAKRMHEYKRQHMNAMHIIRQYLDLKENPNMDFVPRTYFFGAKAAPGYYIAKQMIRLICGMQELLENDEMLRDRLRIVYLEDYRVTLSELLMPAAEISEQISLSGTEASGTGNMKLMLNGALTIGTLDGANVEIRECAGADNFFLFGMTKEEVLAKKAGYNPQKIYESNPRIAEVIDFIAKGFGGNSYVDLANNLKFQDPYLVLADFDSYASEQNHVDAVYKDKALWNKMSVFNIANAGHFSADRAVNEYAGNIWNLRHIR